MAKGEREWGARDVAGKLLELFGPNGEHWIQELYCIGDSYCLMGGICHLFRETTQIRVMLKPFLPKPEKCIEAFNDCSDWPTIKSWLEGIRDGKEATDGR